MSALDYDAHLAAVEYFPAAARTLDSHTGLIFRKQPKLIASLAMAALASVVTADGDDLESLAKWAFREQALTNDGGILVDFPNTPGDLSLAESVALDLRPFAARYAAEAILAIEYGVRGGRKRLVRVVLQDDDETIRELAISDSEYQVTIHRKAGDQWAEAEAFTPLRNGEPLSEIPFCYLGTAESRATFDDLCAVNASHFLASAKLEMAMMWLARPKPWIAGVSDDVELDASPGSIWRFENENTQVGMLEPKGGLATLENQLERFNKSMQQLGLRMLQSERAPAEAAEVVARRQASENSILASSARHISAKLTTVLTIMAEWMNDPEPIAYSLNTDFIPSAIDPKLIDQLLTLAQAGKLTDRELFDALQRGEIIDEAVSYEAHAAALDTLPIDPMG